MTPNLNQQRRFYCDEASKWFTCPYESPADVRAWFAAQQNARDWLVLERFLSTRPALLARVEAAHGETAYLHGEPYRRLEGLHAARALRENGFTPALVPAIPTREELKQIKGFGPQTRAALARALSYYRVVDSSATPPRGFGRYRKLAILEFHGWARGADVRLECSERGRHARDLWNESGRLHAEGTDTAYARALAEWVELPRLWRWGK